jgi:hypothetical protein
MSKLALLRIKRRIESIDKEINTEIRLSLNNFEKEALKIVLSAHRDILIDIEEELK